MSAMMEGVEPIAWAASLESWSNCAAIVCSAFLQQRQILSLCCNSICLEWDQHILWVWHFFPHTPYPRQNWHPRICDVWSIDKEFCIILSKMKGPTIQQRSWGSGALWPYHIAYHPEATSLIKWPLKRVANHKLGRFSIYTKWAILR